MESRPFVRRKQIADRRLVFALAIAALVASLGAASVVAFGPGVPESMRGPLRIASVSYAPDDPAPGEPITVTAEVAGELVRPTVTLRYAAYFGIVASGTVPMTPAGGRTYEATVHDFPDGTEVWFVVSVAAPNAMPVVSDSFTVDVGTVLRGGESALRIVDVRHIPTEPRPMQPITIEATVTSRVPVVEVDIAYMTFCRALTVPVDPPMIPAAPTVYTFTIEPGGPDDPCAFQPDSLLLYRVLARDVTGNTAVSDVVAVTIR